MEKTYQPSQIESHWYQTWESKGYFKPSGEGEPYCIMIPPPNVTGSLHYLIDRAAEVELD